MNHFSDISKKRLSTCHRDLRILFAHVINDYDCTIVCGHRDEAEQNKAFREGKSQLQFPKSKHNRIPSEAVDAAPYEHPGIDWGKTQAAYFAGYVKGIADKLYTMGVISHRIRSGIDWDNDNDIDDTNFWDAYHFELIPNA